MRGFPRLLFGFCLMVGCDDEPSPSDAGVADAADPLVIVRDAAAHADAAAAHDDAAVSPRCSTPPHAPACDDRMCVVPAGCFVMGSPLDEPCREPSEVQREVTLTHDFLLSRREITRAELRAALGYEVFGVLADHPASELTWHEAAAYANALSDGEGLDRCYACSGAGPAVSCAPAPEYAASIYGCPGYRHPTEAEWEHAYRAGGTSALHGGALTATCAADPRADAIAWYQPNARGAVHTPGGREANAWGLFDMAGNVFEWVFDRAVDRGAEPVIDPAPALTAPDDQVVIRSGSWEADARFVRAAARVPFPAAFRLYSVGARVARTLPPAAARPVGVSDGGVTDAAVPEACSPSVLPAPLQEQAGPRVHVQVPFEGREQLLLVDTGSPRTNFYLPPSAPELSLGVGLVTVGCEQVPFASRNVRAGQAVRGLPVLGTLGNDWLLSRPTAIDLGAQTITRWAGAAEIAERASLVRLPVVTSQERMLVEARIDGTPVRLLLDTGTPLTLWIGPTGGLNDRLITLQGEDGQTWEVREGPGSIELAGEPAFVQPIWRAPRAGALEAHLRSLGPDVVGILGLSSFRSRRVYFGAEEGAVLLGP